MLNAPQPTSTQTGEERGLFAAVALAVVPRWVHPNHLTAARLALAVAATASLIAGRTVIFVALFTFGLLTDLLDGAVARARAQASKLGQVLDPVADKALTLPPLIWLMQNQSLTWLLGAIVARELLVVLASALALGRRAEVRSNLSGKLYLTALGLSLLAAIAYPSATWLAAAFSVTVALGAASLISYLYRYLKA